MCVQTNHLGTGGKNIRTRYYLKFFLPVKTTLQRHPKSPRAWATLINSSPVNEMMYKPIRHEPCLYYGTFQGKEVLFLRQGDDFVIACRVENVCKTIITQIDKCMKLKLRI